MTTVPVRFKRISAAFDDVARARLCESSGSEHSAAAEDEMAPDLSELIDSFLEGECESEGPCGGEEKKRREEERVISCDELEAKERLLSLIGGDAEEEDGSVARRIRSEAEIACRKLSGDSSSEGFKRRLMSWLRQRGFDAGLCKSRWEKTPNHPAGEHVYVDIVFPKSGRYILELSPATEFTIARPTDSYACMMKAFPQILICKEYQMKQLLRLMCTAMRQSLKRSDMHVPPWRRLAYLQAKWLRPYRRTTNAECTAEESGARGVSARKILVGFEMAAKGAFLHGWCGGEVVRAVDGGLQVGKLKVAMGGIP